GQSAAERGEGGQDAGGVYDAVEPRVALGFAGELDQPERLQAEDGEDARHEVQQQAAEEREQERLERGRRGELPDADGVRAAVHHEDAVDRRRRVVLLRRARDREREAVAGGALSLRRRVLDQLRVERKGLGRRG